MSPSKTENMHRSGPISVKRAKCTVPTLFSPTTIISVAATRSVVSLPRRTRLRGLSGITRFIDRCRLSPGAIESTLGGRSGRSSLAQTATATATAADSACIINDRAVGPTTAACRTSSERPAASVGWSHAHGG